MHTTTQSMGSEQRRAMTVRCGIVFLGTCTTYACMTPGDTSIVLDQQNFILAQRTFITSLVGVGGAAVVFWVGLRQYWRSEQWKRAEFVAKELKEFLADAHVTVTLTLIDWSERRIQLRRLGDPDNKAETNVTREMQCHALMPHVLVDATLDAEHVRSEADAALAHFSTEHAIIRDCYDVFLDGLERVASYVTSELVSVEELRPYLQYWIDDIAAVPTDGWEATWTACLVAYIDFYKFTGVQDLFAQFGHHITLDSPLFARCLEDSADREIAAKLRTLVSRQSREVVTI